MTSGLRVYIGAWAVAFLAACVLLARNRGRCALFEKGYWSLLAQPWKLLTFAAAAFLMIDLGYPGNWDPTWDRFDATVMSLLTFTTAPWAVGIAYRAAKGRSAPWETYAAGCVWLFSASWFYDGYILLRDGRYPPTWAANLVVSSVLYMAAGLLWSVDAGEGKPLYFSFEGDAWPQVEPAPFRMVVWPALLLIAVGAGIMLPFVWSSGLSRYLP
ncbi:MAG: hypothetical protein HY078_14005 [Elusimicrobia bacterium]|nr:hypothetical protein [Elusimicrobiota bacterium]